MRQQPRLAEVGLDTSVQRMCVCYQLTLPLENTKFSVMRLLRYLQIDSSEKNRNTCRKSIKNSRLRGGTIGKVKLNTLGLIKILVLKMADSKVRVCSLFYSLRVFEG